MADEKKETVVLFFSEWFSIALINVGAVFRLPSSVCNMEMFEAVEHNVGPE